MQYLGFDHGLSLITKMLQGSSNIELLNTFIDSVQNEVQQQVGPCLARTIPGEEMYIPVV